MVSSRHITVLSSLLVAGIVGAWWAAQTPQPDSASRAIAWEPAAAVRGSGPTGPSQLAIEGKQPLDLLTDTASRGGTNADARADKPKKSAQSNQLKLALPDMSADAVERVAGAADIVSNRPPEEAFDLTPEPAPLPEVESITLFNPDYGLSGFLKQQWISQRFGVQAGLGLNDDRRINTEDGFRDDLAVGMGIILTF